MCVKCAVALEAELKVLDIRQLKTLHVTGLYDCTRSERDTENVGPQMASGLLRVENPCKVAKYRNLAIQNEPASTLDAIGVSEIMVFQLQRITHPHLMLWKSH